MGKEGVQTILIKGKWPIFAKPFINFRNRDMNYYSFLTQQHCDPRLTLCHVLHSGNPEQSNFPHGHPTSLGVMGEGHPPAIAAPGGDRSILRVTGRPKSFSHFPACLLHPRFFGLFFFFLPPSLSESKFLHSCTPQVFSELAPVRSDQ